MLFPSIRFDGYDEATGNIYPTYWIKPKLDIDKTDCIFRSNVMEIKHCVHSTRGIIRLLKILFY